MGNFKEYLLSNGNSLVFWIRDVMAPNETRPVCFTVECSDILGRVISEGSFESLTEDECIVLIKEFIEPVTFKDIDIVSIDPFYFNIHNCCGELWLSLPSKLKSIIRGNA